MTQFSFWIITLAAFGLTARFGGREDRLGVAALLASAVLSPLVQNVWLDDLRWGVALVDLAAFASLAALAVRFDRWWLILAAGLQLVVVLTHIAAMGPAWVFNWTAVTIRWVTWLSLLGASGLGAMEGYVVRKYRLGEPENG